MAYPNPSAEGAVTPPNTLVEAGRLASDAEIDVDPNPNPDRVALPDPIIGVRRAASKADTEEDANMTDETGTGAMFSSLSTEGAVKTPMALLAGAESV